MCSVRYSIILRSTNQFVSGYVFQEKEVLSTLLQSILIGLKSVEISEKKEPQTKQLQQAKAYSS